MRGKVIGYLVTWRGDAMRDFQGDPKLYYPSGWSTMWPTYSRARAAMRRSIRAWARADEARQWAIKPVRKALPPPAAPGSGR